MATAVASGCSSSPSTSSCGGGGGGSNSGGGPPTSLPSQDKGQSNKRKLPPEAPAPDTSSTTSLYSFYAPGYGKDFSSAKHPDGCEVSTDCSFVSHPLDGCDVCTGLASAPRDGPNIDEIEDADWNDLTESELKEIMLSHIGTVIDDYVRKIVSSGFSEDDAVKAVMKAGVSYGGRDPVSRIMDSALSLLKNDHDAASLNESTFESLDNLENHILEAMVFALREAQPIFSYGDAMWLLLVYDLDIDNACQVNTDPSGGPGTMDMTHSLPAPQTNQSSSNVTASTKTDPVSNGTDPPKYPNFDLSHFYSKALSRPVEVLPSDIPLDVEIPKLLAEWSSSLTNTHMRKPGHISGKGRSTSISVHASVGPPYTATSHPNSADDKSCTMKKSQRSNSKKNSIMLQKSILFEKHYTAYGPKGAVRASKFGGLGSLVLDKKNKSSSSRINMKGSSIKVSKSIRLDASQGDGVSTYSFTEDKCKALPPNSEEKTCSSPSLTGDSYSSTSFPPEASDCGAPDVNAQSSIADTANLSITGLTDKMTGNWVPRDKKDELLLRLTTRAEELRLQLDEWTEWAQQKVMQAARRLNKDKAEIQALRHEKEEAERVIKERQNLEQSSMKKLSEIESALLKADCQQAWASGAKCRLEIENATLRQEMEAAKLQATESASSCLDLSRRETTAAQNSQSCDQQKQLLKEEIVVEQHKLSQLQKQLEKALENQHRLEDRWKQEQKLKDEARTQANSLLWEREQIEATAKSKEDLIRLADGGLQKRMGDVQRLENQIKQLRENLRSSTNSLAWGASAEDGKQQLNLGYLSEFADLQLDWDGDLQRDRECVMCMVVEKSVIFLPCGHQVVCVECNELHEKQGMKDCPSCRTPIEKRIPARFRGAL